MKIIFNLAFWGAIIFFSMSIFGNGEMQDFSDLIFDKLANIGINLKPFISQIKKSLAETFSSFNKNIPNNLNEITKEIPKLT
jgi:hypothetical protein